MRIAITILVAIFLICAQACQFNSEEELFPRASGGCDTTDAKYSLAVSKILNTNCALAGCHKGQAVRQTIGDFENHEGAKIYLDANKQRFLNAINHNAGASPMPKNGAKLNKCDILMLETWISKGYPNN